MSEFTQDRRKQIAELRPFEDYLDLVGVSISEEDKKAGSPKEGDMIARNPKNHADQWLVAAQYFADNFEPVDGPAATPMRPSDSELLGVLNAAIVALKSRDQSSFEMKVLEGLKIAMAQLEAAAVTRPHRSPTENKGE